MVKIIKKADGKFKPIIENWKKEKELARAKKIAKARRQSTFGILADVWPTK